MDQDPVPLPVHPAAVPEKSSLNRVAPSAPVTLTSSYRAEVAQVDRPILPEIGTTVEAGLSCVLGTTCVPTLFMNSFWTS